MIFTEDIKVPEQKNPEKVRFNSPYHFKAKSEVDKKGGPLLRGGINHASRARTRTPSSIYSWSIQSYVIKSAPKACLDGGLLLCGKYKEVVCFYVSNLLQ